jgi:hypothetical protein
MQACAGNTGWLVVPAIVCMARRTPGILNSPGAATWMAKQALSANIWMRVDAVFMVVRRSKASHLKHSALQRLVWFIGVVPKGRAGLSFSDNAKQIF